MRDQHQFIDADNFLDELEKEDKPHTIKNDRPESIDIEYNVKKQTTKGLSQGQKLFLSFLLFLLVLAFGFFIMLITGTMVLP